MRSLLLSEVYTTSLAYSELYFALLVTLKKAAPSFYAATGTAIPSDLTGREGALFSLAHEWVMYTLHLTQFGMSQFAEAYPHWKAILNKARGLVFKRLSEQDEVRYLIQSLRARKVSIGDSIIQLERMFDLDLNVDKRTRKYMELAPGALYQVMVERLKGSTSTPEIRANVLTYQREQELTGSILRGVKELLESVEGAIGASFGVLTGTDVLKRWDPVDPNAALTEQGSQALLATWPESFHFSDPMKRILGAALLLPREGHSQDRLLSYIWVDPMFRSLGIGRRLLENAVRVASASSARRIVVQVADYAYESVTSFLRENSFELHRDIDRRESEDVVVREERDFRPITMSRLIAI
jgi:ribosomal protein S18 acetylase RimI-like enzyme